MTVYSQRNGDQPAIWACSNCLIWYEVPSNQEVPLCFCSTPESEIEDAVSNNRNIVRTQLDLIIAVGREGIDAFVSDWIALKKLEEANERA